MTTNNTQGGGQGNTDTAKPGGEQQQTPAAGAGGETGKGGETKTGDDGKGGEAVKDPKTQGNETQQGKTEQGKGGEAAKKAPAKYELSIPEKSTLDDSDLKMIEDYARENDLDNAAAQALIQQRHDLLIEQSDRFKALTEADPELGGDKLATTLQRAKAGLDFLRPASHPRAKAFRALIDKAGWANHPEIVAAFADLGKMTEEDGVVSGAGGGSSEKTQADTLYDHPTSKT